jgi:alanyl-tRNA synthetase
LNKPFLAQVSYTVIATYGGAYPELRRNEAAILDAITREEERFQRTVETGVSRLDELLADLKSQGGKVLDGQQAFDLYATLGLPLELTRDIAREQGLDVDEEDFKLAMEEHRLASGAGKAFGAMGGEDVDIYRAILQNLEEQGKVKAQGIEYDPYNSLEVEGPILALLKNGISVQSANPGEEIELILPSTCFYVESGGQVSDTGTAVSKHEPRWEINVVDMRKPAAGMVVHIGKVVKGQPKVGDLAITAVDAQRRRDIMRNHTATHLLHAALHEVLGAHALQAGSLVAPDRLRFDFNHPIALSAAEVEEIEARVNQAILLDYPLKTIIKPLHQAISEGAMALFGEKYGENVRTVTIGLPDPASYELCGGTHVHETGDIGLFLVTSEGSAAAGVRRIEAVTGRGAYELVQRRFRSLKQTAAILAASLDEVPAKALSLLDDMDASRKQLASLRQELVSTQFSSQLEGISQVSGIPVMVANLPNADAETLRQMADKFRLRYKSGVVVLASVVDGKPTLIAAVTDDLVKRGLHAGELVKVVALPLGGSGGGRPTLAQAGGKDASRLSEALDQVIPWVKKILG